ncbi:MAG: hypothetical protein IPJ69_13340 [Deltaproteobacteria bacterium]|nr:MAG: hypothetical protein IPJ69_13340 [Deltaproteobacteria bacterium]
MKQPKTSNLKIDSLGTQRIRASFKKHPKIKITINIDADLLTNIKDLSSKIHTPYQTYLNHLLRETVLKKHNEESRLDKIERELAFLKKSLAA